MGGEQVLARNEKAHEMAYCGVLGTIVAEEQAIYRVVIGNGSGNTETLRTTAEHPFWIKDEGWKKASLLMAGDLLLDLDSKVLTVLEAEPQCLFETVYNIEVAEFHTYHAGNFGVWVHNITCTERLERFIDIEGDGINNMDALVPESRIESAEFIIQAQQENVGNFSYWSKKGALPVYALFGGDEFINISDTEGFHNFASDLEDHPDLKKGNFPGLGEGIILLKSTTGNGKYNMHLGAVVGKFHGGVVISDVSERDNVANTELALIVLTTKKIISPDDFRGDDYSADDYAMGLLTSRHSGEGWKERK